MPGPLLTVTVMGFLADRAAAALVGRTVRMGRVVRRPHLARAARAAAVWEMRITTCEQVVAAAALVRRAQMRRRVKEEMEVMAAHPASQIHPSPMQAAVAVLSRQTLTLVPLEALVAVETVVQTLLVSTARTASEAVVAAAPILMRAETVATAS